MKHLSIVLLVALALAGCTASVSTPPTDADDPVAVIQQAEDESTDDASSTDAEEQAASEDDVTCTRCGPGPQPWHAPIRVHHHKRD